MDAVQGHRGAAILMHAVNYPCGYMHNLPLNTALCVEQQYICKLTAQAALNTGITVCEKNVRNI